jgi:hypothetical protein
MTNLDIYAFTHSVTLLMPLAGIGRSFRLETLRASFSAAPTETVPTKTDGLSMRWRMDSQGKLIAEWAA